MVDHVDEAYDTVETAIDDLDSVDILMSGLFNNDMPAFREALVSAIKRYIGSIQDNLELAKKDLEALAAERRASAAKAA